MRKFIEKEIENIKIANVNHHASSENSLRQLSTFIESLVVDSSALAGEEKSKHLIQGLIAMSKFIDKNMEIAAMLRSQEALLQRLVETYDKNKKLADKIVNDDEKRFRKIGEKPDSIREKRNVKKRLELYEDDNENT